MKFPERISQKSVKQLEELLPGKSTPLIPDDAERVTLLPIPESELINPRDEEDEHGGEQVRCATQ